MQLRSPRRRSRSRSRSRSRYTSTRGGERGGRSRSRERRRSSRERRWTEDRGNRERMVQGMRVKNGLTEVDLVNEWKLLEKIVLQKQEKLSHVSEYTVLFYREFFSPPSQRASVIERGIVKHKIMGSHFIFSNIFPQHVRQPVDTTYQIN